MPELVDVEGFRRYVARYAEGRRLRRVEVPAPEILRNTTPGALGRALHGRRLGRPERRGKWLLVPFGGPRLVLHFGMTGQLVWHARPTAPHAHDRLILRLGGGELRYRAQRKIGGAWLLAAGQPLESLTGPLGPDADDVDREGFARRLRGRRGGLKSALMEQSLFAGLGNELSDEILWRARLAPRTAAGALERPRVDRLYDAVQGVLREALPHARIPRAHGWLEGVRDAPEPRCPRCGHRIERRRAAGRTSLVCPRCQAA